MRAGPGSECLPTYETSPWVGNGHEQQSWGPILSDEGQPELSSRPEALFPISCAPDNGAPPHTSCTWASGAKRPVLWPQRSRRAPTTSDPQVRARTAGLWPRVKGLQSLRLGVCFFGFVWGFSFLFGASQENFELKFPGNSNSGKICPSEIFEFLIRPGISRSGIEFLPNRGPRRGPNRFGREPGYQERAISS